MNVAIVGCGTMGQLYARLITKMKEMTITAVYHYDEQKGNSFAKEYGGQVYTDYEQMLKEPSVDMVLITLPTYLHRDFVIRAAAHGKHIFCEKPVALQVEEAEEMIEVCAKNNVRLYIAHVVRFFPEYEQISEQVRAETSLEKVSMIHAKRYNSSPPAQSWYADLAQSGGMVLDLMIHDIDFLLSVMGDVRSVYAKGNKSGSMEYVSAVLKFKNKGVALVEAFWGYPGGFATQLEIHGESGLLHHISAKTETLGLYEDKERSEKAEGVEVPSNHSERDPYRQQLQHFYDQIRSGEPFIVSEAEILQSLRTTEAILRSLETGEEQILIADETIP